MSHDMQKYVLGSLSLTSDDPERINPDSEPGLISGEATVAVSCG